MRSLIQRVTEASLHPKGRLEENWGSIGKGILILAGFEENDRPVGLEQMAQKIRSLRVFRDNTGKMNLSAGEVGAQYLVVSQFTLYADCKYGNRPSFEGAAPKAKAKEYYEFFVQALGRIVGPEKVVHGPFGSDLEVRLSNDGPVTLWLDSREIL